MSAGINVSGSGAKPFVIAVTQKWRPAYIQHGDVIKWKHFPRYWPFVRRIHRSPVNSPHKSQWRRALMFSLICARIKAWVNNREAGDLRCIRAHYDVIVMERWRHIYIYMFYIPAWSENYIAPIQDIARTNNSFVSDNKSSDVSNYVCQQAVLQHVSLFALIPAYISKWIRNLHGTTIMSPLTTICHNRNLFK